MSPKEKLIAAVAAGVAGGAVLNYPGAMIGAWAAAIALNHKAGMKKIAIAGGIGTVVGLVTTKGLWAAKSARF